MKKRHSMYKGRVALTAFCLVFAGSAANSTPSITDKALLTAFAYSDAPALATLSAQADDANIKRLADIMRLTVQHKEADALALYARLDRRGLSRPLRQAAFINEAILYERLNRHNLVVKAIDAAAKAGGDNGPFIDATRALHASLGRIITDRLANRERGTLLIKRDANQDPLVTVSINGHSEDALIDTGSSFAVTSASNARRLGLHMFKGRTQSTGASGRQVSMKIATAAHLRFGNATFDDVLFMVLPDRYWYDPPQQIIVGMSLLRPLGRLEFDRSEGQDRLIYGHSLGEAVGAANMTFHWQTPQVIAQINAEASAGRILIDTGAAQTLFNQTLLRDFPDIKTTSQPAPFRYQGIDGVNADPSARLIANIDLSIDTATINIKNAWLINSVGPPYHGLFGEETLLSTRKTVLDFDHMYFAMQ